MSFIRQCRRVSEAHAQRAWDLATPDDSLEEDRTEAEQARIDYDLWREDIAADRAEARQ